jgi:hypothetical protein
VNDMVRIPPHEKVKLLRKGERVLCSKCVDGVMVPVGDYKMTNTFYCDKCGQQIIIN